MILYTLDIDEESPSFGHGEPNRNPDRITLLKAEDPANSEICQAINTQVVRPDSASSTLPPDWFSCHLSELDAQLASLQNIADCLEMDFSNSRMVAISNLFYFFIYPEYNNNDS